MSMKINDIQDQLKAQASKGEEASICVVSGTLAQHRFLTKPQTQEEADKEKEEKKLSFAVTPGYKFSIKDPVPVFGEGILKEYIGSMVKDGYLGVKPMRYMPELLCKNEAGELVSISKEFENQPISYQGQVQLKFRIKVANNRAYVDCVAVLFEEKPDVYVPEERTPSTTGWYGGAASAVAAQAEAPAQVVTPPTTNSPWAN